jgi:hypothetical protein
LSVVGHVALLLGLTYIGAGAVWPIAPEAMIVEIVPASEAPASPAPADREMNFDGTHLDSTSTGSEVSSDSDKGSARTGRPEPKPALPSMKQAQGNLKEKRNGGAQAARPAAQPEEPETQPQADEPLLLPTTPVPQERLKEAADKQKAGEMFAMPLALPSGRIGGGLDAPSAMPAKLAHDDTAAFKARLSSCTHVPIGLTDDNVAIALRISFKRDGTLASQPKLLAASLSPDAGLLLTAAVTALETCQPFTELPPDKYSKWKTLELVLSPIALSAQSRD